MIQSKEREFHQNGLIVETPSKEMKLSIIVPVCAEFSNGYIFRFIESFTKQSVSSNLYEIIFLVNNSPEDARLKSTVYQENQIILSVGQYLKSDNDFLAEDLEKQLSSYQKDILKKAKEKK